MALIHRRRVPHPYRRPRRLRDPLREFLHNEASGGVALVVATLAALVWANSPWGETYGDFWHHELTLGIADLSITEDLQHWVNDALMVLFFFVVGLEIKRELVTGELQDRRAARLPAVAACGGVILPAAIFIAIVGTGEAASGWAIPMATDIAFAVGVLALLGNRVGRGVKLFLLTIAIVDDVLAISVIAIFYTDDLSLGWLLAAVAIIGLIVVMQRVGVSRVAAYIPVGLLLWLATLESGVHATIAGVVLGLLTPANPVGGRHVLEQLEHRLHPVTSFVVIPIFALANAGVALGGDRIVEAVNNSLMWAIAAGLIVGKLLGIAGATLLGIRLRIGILPAGVTRAQLWGVSALGGIGFTVSLFITQLAYTDQQLIDTAKIGIFAGSLISGVLGASILMRAQRQEPR